jgi:hypothetical protein
MNKPPAAERFKSAEWHLIQKFDTPAKVQRFFSRMPYNWEKKGGTLRSFREVLKRNEAHCLEAAVGAAVILEQHGYPPLLLDIESWDLLDHVIFVYKDDGRWGSVARSRDIGLTGRKPVFRSLRDLVWSYFDPYVDLTGRIKGYGLASLYDLGDYDWRFSPRRMIRIENYLREMPHKKLKSSDERYKKLLARYQKFKQRFPDRRPSARFYDSPAEWML